jgi:hypothetical protein
MAARLGLPDGWTGGSTKRRSTGSLLPAKAPAELGESQDRGQPAFPGGHAPASPRLLPGWRRVQLREKGKGERPFVAYYIAPDGQRFLSYIKAKEHAEAILEQEREENEKMAERQKKEEEEKTDEQMKEDNIDIKKGTEEDPDEDDYEQPKETGCKRKRIRDDEASAAKRQRLQDETVMFTFEASAPAVILINERAKKQRIQMALRNPERNLMKKTTNKVNLRRHGAKVLGDYLTKSKAKGELKKLNRKIKLVVSRKDLTSNSNIRPFAKFISET